MNSLEEYVNSHLEDFKNGVDSEYIKNMNIEGLTTLGIQIRLNSICDVVRKQTNGNRRRIYKLKEGYEYIPKIPKVEEVREKYIDINGRLYKELKVNKKYLITIDSPYIVCRKNTKRIVDLWYDEIAGKAFVKLDGTEYYYEDLV